MNKLLSQDEVDALLSGLDTGDIETIPEPEETDVTFELFEWTAQGGDIKSSMPLLGIVNDRFSQKLKGSLSASIHRMVDISAGMVEMVKFSEFQKSLPIPTNLHLFKIAPLRGTGLFVVESRLVYSLVEIFFGGKGTSSTKIEGREFSPIEMKIIGKVVHLALTSLMESWEDVYPIKTDFIRSESNPLFLNEIPPDEYLITVTFEIELNKPLGTFTLCIPYSSLQPIRHKLSGGYSEEEELPDQFWLNGLKERLSKTPVEMTVELGCAHLSVKDLLNLKEGDIVILENDFKRALMAKVEGIPKYEGFAGRFNTKKVFRVEQPIIYPN